MNAFHRLHQLRMENQEAAYTMEELRPRFEKLRDRHDNGTAPQVVSSFNLFPTPEREASRAMKLLNPEPGEAILDPSAGFGNLINQAPPSSLVVAVEISPDCCQALYNINREYHGEDMLMIHQRDFLEWNGGKFKFIIMNPPFHMRADIKHVNHALSMLEKGGRLVSFLMNTRHREEAFRDRAKTWEVLPAGTFPGTKIETVLMSIQN